MPRNFSESPDFTRLPTEGRNLFLHALTSCAWDEEKPEIAFAAVSQATVLRADWAPLLRLLLALRFERDAMVMESFTTLARAQPRDLATLQIQAVWAVLKVAAEADPSGTQKLAVHETLVAANYKPEDDIRDDGLRLSHAQLLVRHGQLERARERLSTIDSPSLLLSLRVSKLYDPLRTDDAFERRLDLRAAAEAHLARTRADAAAQPRKLGLVNDVAQALRTLGRDGEALALIDAALSGGRVSNRFDDVGDYLNWTLNEKGYLLYALNRPQEARRAFRDAIAAKEGGETSVSQVINFASMLQAEGRSTEALETLGRMGGSASPYGDMWAASVRVCAYQDLGDAPRRDETLAFMKAHERDNVAALARALLCVNDLDGAAALYIRRLADDEQRDDALTALQRFPSDVRTPLPRTKVLRERLALVRARPDVQAAVDAVGRIEDVPLAATYWGDV